MTFFRKTTMRHDSSAVSRSSGSDTSGPTFPPWLDEFLEEAYEADLVLQLQGKVRRHRHELAVAANLVDRHSSGQHLRDVPDTPADQLRVGQAIGPNLDVLQAVDTILDATDTFRFERDRLGGEVHARQSRQEPDDQDQTDQSENVGDGVGRGDVRHDLLCCHAVGQRDVTGTDGLLCRGQGRRARQTAGEKTRGSAGLELQQLGEAERERKTGHRDHDCQREVLGAVLAQHAEEAGTRLQAYREDEQHES